MGLTEDNQDLVESEDSEHRDGDAHHNRDREVDFLTAREAFFARGEDVEERREDEAHDGVESDPDDADSERGLVDCEREAQQNDAERNGGEGVPPAGTGASLPKELEQHHLDWEEAGEDESEGGGEEEDPVDPVWSPHSEVSRFEDVLVLDDDLFEGRRGGEGDVAEQADDEVGDEDDGGVEGEGNSSAADSGALELVENGLDVGLVEEGVEEESECNLDTLHIGFEVVDVGGRRTREVEDAPHDDEDVKHA